MTPKGRPHVGNINRDRKICELYDSGSYSPKEIASQVTAMGWHCSTKMVYEAVKRRRIYKKFYMERGL